MLRSRTAHNFYLNLSFKKRRSWIVDFLQNLQSEQTLAIKNDQGISVLELYQDEFVQQPYCGFYLSYLLFYEFSDNPELVRKAFTNITPFDFLVQIALIERAHGLQINDASFDD